MLHQDGPPSVSIFQPVIQVLDHFVLKADDPGLVLPPGVDVVLERGQGLDLDLDLHSGDLGRQSSYAFGFLV
jgi:hypothetical protein